MAFPLFRLRQGDSLPVFLYTVTSDGAPVNLGSVASVTLHLLSRDRRSGTKSFACTVQDAANGVIQHAWTEAETVDLVGEYDGEVEVLFSNGSKRTSPTGGYLRFICTAQLDGLAPNDPNSGTSKLYLWSQNGTRFTITVTNAGVLQVFSS